jgi:LPS-assembly lipoprotein
MWSSDALDACRRGARGALLLASMALAACTLRPLLHAVDDNGVRTQLEATKVVGLDGRLGQLVRNALLDQLNPAGVDSPSDFILQVRLQRNAQALGIQSNNDITRFNLRLTARFELVEAKSGKVLYESQVQRIASYNVGSQPYATLSAETDAERRVAREVGTNIRTELAVYFARQTSPV